MISYCFGILTGILEQDAQYWTRERIIERMPLPFFSAAGFTTDFMARGMPQKTAELQGAIFFEEIITTIETYHKQRV
jgi:hypothetical protein